MIEEYVNQFLSLWSKDKCQAFHMLRNVDYSNDAEEFYTLLMQKSPVIYNVILNTDYC